VLIAAHGGEVAVRHAETLQADGELDVTRAHNVLDLEILWMGGQPHMGGQPDIQRQTRSGPQLVNSGGN